MSEWAHAMSSFRGQWLPGDERGFRSRGHRIHSSGDYHHRPPPEEHAGLRRFAQSIAGEPISLSPMDRERAGLALLDKFCEMNIRVAAIAIAMTHAHSLIRVGQADAKVIFGRAKQASSHALRNTHPGKLWGASSKVVRVKSLEGFVAQRFYILSHKSAGAWTWADPEITRDLAERGRLLPRLRRADAPQPRRLDPAQLSESSNDS